MRGQPIAQILSSPLLALVACAVTTLAAQSDAYAQRYPERPLRLIVTNVAGGPPDTAARIVGRQLSANVGQPVIVDNRPGAAGTIALSLGAKASPDGYTIMFGILGAVGLAPTLYSKLPYNPVTDFAPVTLIAVYPNVVLVSSAAPFKSVKDLIALARAKPGQLNFAAGSSGSVPYLSAELFRKAADIRMVYVPYKGGIEALPHLMAGRLELMFANIGLGLPHVKAGNVAALAVTSAARSPLLPDTPTLAEAGGLPGYETYDWFGILLPAATPRSIVAQLHGEMIKVLRESGVQSQLGSQGAQIVANTPAEFASFIRSEIAKWAEVIKSSGARID